MRRHLMILTTLFTLAADQAAAYHLSQHQWRHRLLFLVAHDSNDPDLSAKQREIELQRDALFDRDVRVFLLLPENGFVDDDALPTLTVARLREQLEVTPEDRLLILMGKDGGIKRRTELHTDLRDIFLQIDSMPMRRDEIRAKREAGMEVTTP